MQLVRHDPFSLFQDLDRWFDASSPKVAEWMPRLDVMANDDSWVVRAEVPGVDAEDVDITVEDGLLTIQGTRTFRSDIDEEGYTRKEIYEGGFSRSVRLPKGIDPEGITASHKNGVFEITVPKAAEVLPKRIPVSVN